MATPNTIDADLYGVTIGNAALEGFMASVRPLTRFSTNLSGEIGTRNQAVTVPLFTDPAVAAADKTEGSAYTRQASEVSEVTVTLNKHKYVSAEITDNEVNASNIRSVEQLGRMKGRQLALDVSNDVLSIVTNSNYGAAAFTGASTAFDHSEVVTLQGVADAANWMEEGRILVVKPAYYNALFNDSVTADLVSGDILRTGQLPNIQGFEILKHFAVPANSENLVGFIAVANGIAFASRYMAPAGGGKPGSIYRNMTDEKTGLTLGYREFYDDDNGTRVAIWENWYGYSVGVTAGLERLVSS